MDTRVDEIAQGIYRISTYVPEIVPPAGFTFNQILVDAEQPLLFHTGPRAMFPLVRESVSRVVPADRIRWITFGHVESDECGSMNQWLQTAPRAEVCFGATGAMVSLNDLADRPLRVMADGEVLDLGGKRVRLIDTPHVPHNWEAQVFFEETTRTLLCGDLFYHFGAVAPLTETDIVGPATAAEDISHSSSLSAHAGATVRKLAALEPRTLALMHGASYTGDCAGALNALAAEYDRRVRDVLEQGISEAIAAGCPTV